MVPSYSAAVENFYSALDNSDVPKAKAELARHVTAIEMVPESEGKGRHYIAVGQWNLLGGVDDAERVRMVAGEGFEPSTFGL